MIVLIGFMGAGKTTVGYLLAEKLGVPFVDIDIHIERKEKRSVRAIFDEDGEAAFRQIEHNTVVEILSGPDAVVALGGGAAEHAGTRLALAGAIVIYLEVEYDEAVLRIGHDAYRPMMSMANVRGIYERRQPLYRSIATLKVRTNGRRPEAIVMEIIEAVVAPATVPDQVQSILVAPMGGAHYVHIGERLIERFGDLMPVLHGGENAFVVSAIDDVEMVESVADGLRSRGLVVSTFVVPLGPRCKSFEIVHQLSLFLASHNAHRDDVIVGVGDDSLCYLVGFVASTFNRGIKLALLPTTLLGQVDLAIGGKNAINLPQGSNLIGTIYQPIVVVDDVDISSSRRRDGFVSGIAETIKHALIADAELLSFLLENAPAILLGDKDLLCSVVARSVDIKAQIVAADEREQGERIYLNYGHTFGHAFEYLLEETPDRHGQAVALGMMAAAYLAYRQGRISKGVVEQHRQILSAYGLCTFGRFYMEDMHRAWMHDKKYRGGVRFVVLNGIGLPEGGVEVSNETLVDVLNDLAT